MESFTLKPRPPFRLDLAAWILRRRFENQVDRWDGSVYRRVLPTTSKPLLLEVTQSSGPAKSRLAVRLRGAPLSPQSRAVATAALERLLGIRLELSGFYQFVADKPKLALLAERFRGMKPPRFLTGFECLANAIACQQVSLASGIQLLNRFAEAFGQRFEDDLQDGAGAIQYAFPQADDLLGVDLEQLRTLGFSRQKATAVLDLATLIRTGEFDFDALHGLSDQAAIVELQRLRGVGRWTAEYALLRGLGRLHIFPGDDVGARNGLEKWLGVTDKLNYESIGRLLERWRSIKGLIYLHLLLDKLAATGQVEANPPDRTSTLVNK